MQQKKKINDFVYKEKKFRPRERERDDLPRKKKSLGQHFLRKQSVVDHMIDAVKLDDQTGILEIGCGDGFLTQALMQTKAALVRCYEIDPEWAAVVRNLIPSPRLDLRLENVLEADWSVLADQPKWVVLANLPYQITFPIIFKIMDHKHLFQEGVVMIQEEVAQKIVSTRGRGFGVTPLRLQYHFEELRLLDKVEPGAFAPPPSVFSRLLYFKPRQNAEPIPDAEEFWKFLAVCFHSPRQNLKNNLRGSKYSLEFFSTEELALRAQQMTWELFLECWKRMAQPELTAE
jgi:16S rRNA (adenine1518-N6/adenine1519-N6)-dimethyltransferase